MCELKYKLIELIVLFEYLISIENFPTYKTILSKYKKVYCNICNKEKKDLEDFEPLLNVFKLYFEAIPSDDKLNEYIANKMQLFYEEVKK